MVSENYYLSKISKFDYWYFDIRLDNSRLSSCCNAPTYEDVWICSDCKEHCDEWIDD